MGIRKFGTSESQNIQVEQTDQGIEKTASKAWGPEDEQALAQETPEKDA